MESDGRHISNRLRKHRRILGLTQKEVADKLGLKEKQVSRWECGETIPEFKNLLKLGLFYKALIEELYFEEREKIKAIFQMNEKVEKPDEKDVDREYP